MKNMYKLKNLQKIFKDGEKEKEVLKNIDLEIYNDKITVILGKSGCGKTTLLRIIAGLQNLKCWKKRKILCMDLMTIFFL